MAKKLQVTLNIPNKLDSSRPWIAVEGLGAQGTFELKSEGICMDNLVAAFFNGTNQTFVFRKG